MRIRPTLARVAAAGALTGAVGIGVLAAPVGAAPGQTAKGITITLYVGADPTPTDQSTGSLQPPPPSGITAPVPSNCPFDSNAAIAVTGNAVGHGTGNKNGFWGGNTVTGAAQLTDPGNEAFTGPFNGQATGWQGIGSNRSEDDVTGQLETGQTFHFNGTDANGDTVHVQFDWHFTVNNAGNVTAVKVVFTCS